MAHDNKDYFDQPENINFLLRIFYMLCGLLVVVEIFYHRHVSHSWEGFFGFYAIYGFVACVALVLIAAQLRKLLMRDEQYYDNDN